MDRQAHAITRLLLSDVRDVVSSLRDTSRLNLAEAIRALAVQPVSAQVHLEVPEILHVDDAARSSTSRPRSGTSWRGERSSGRS